MQNQENQDLTKKDYLNFASVIIGAVIIGGAWIYVSGGKTNPITIKDNIAKTEIKIQKSALEEKVLPTEGVVLPVIWGDLGQKLSSVGVIDKEKFIALYTDRGQYTKEYEELLLGNTTNKLVITENNAPYLLNLFWALGLGNKNQILDAGEMADPRYGGASRFASTGGWTLAEGDAMNHYSKHKFFNLTAEQQALVDKVSRGIYRPCCNNSTHFPDCNHGMAMLGLLELMASQGVEEQEMYRVALAVNSFWFPGTYLTLATYMENKGVDWKDVNPQEMLGINYSSATGYGKISSQISAPVNSSQGGSGCAIDGPKQTINSGRQQAGCGI